MAKLEMFNEMFGFLEHLFLIINKSVVPVKLTDLTN
jgi:hypothetical protein